MLLNEELLHVASICAHRPLAAHIRHGVLITASDDIESDSCLNAPISETERLY